MIEIGYMDCCCNCKHRDSELEERIIEHGRVRTIVRCKHDMVCGDILKTKAAIPPVYKGV